MIDISLLPIWMDRLLWILLISLLVFITLRLSERLGRWGAGIVKQRHRGPLSLERQIMLGTIFAGIIRMMTVVVGLLWVLGLFVPVETVVWMVGLFSAAFGLGARPFISDILTGFKFISENTFAVGDKVEMLGVSGVVEKVNLRTTRLRAPSGELYLIPNGDIRIIRNFSRGKYSQVKVTLHIHSHAFDSALQHLEQLGEDAVALLPNLIEPWLVLSEGDLGEKATLVISAKARFGKGAEMKPRLETLVQQRLQEAGIELV